MSEFKVCVSGGREFLDWNTVKNALDEIHERTPITMLIHGGARGADSLAGYWVHLRGVETWVFPAEWTRDENGKVNKGAGHQRNTRMLMMSQPALLVAFPGEKGTADCVKQARAWGISVQEIACP